MNAQPERSWKKKFCAVLSVLLRKRLMVRRGEQTVVCLSLLYCLCALLLAPHVVLPSALLALCLRYRFSLCLDGQGATAGDVERFMDRAASGLRDAGERLSARVTGGTRANARDARYDFRDDDWDG
ncbi:MAG TPA: hypothetical protein IAC36_04375 [Candidatus Aphodomonas merdavium]|nr:hypothetical protein [Candidatus Aphodomonas merdavium]